MNNIASCNRKFFDIFTCIIRERISVKDISGILAIQCACEKDLTWIFAKNQKFLYHNFPSEYLLMYLESKRFWERFKFFKSFSQKQPIGMRPSNGDLKASLSDGDFFEHLLTYLKLTGTFITFLDLCSSKSDFVAANPRLITSVQGSSWLQIDKILFESTFYPSQKKLL